MSRLGRLSACSVALSLSLWAGGALVASAGGTEASAGCCVGGEQSASAGYCPVAADAKPMLGIALYVAVTLVLARRPPFYRLDGDAADRRPAA